MLARLPFVHGLVHGLVLLCASVASAEDRGFVAGDVVSGNPAAITDRVGTGNLGRWLGIPEETGIRLGGVWVGDMNVLMGGGAKPGSVTWNSLVLAGVNLDFEKLAGWSGGEIGAQFLRFDGENTNGDAGSVQGYNGLPGAPPLNRSELYQIWISQSFWEDRIKLRIGKVTPSADFNNVLRAIPVEEGGLEIPAISGLIFTPIFTQPNLLGVLPGYYNSAYGATLTVAPSKQFSFAYGIYDGRGARGVQTGLEIGPEFVGSYFQIAEAGLDWSIGREPLLGRLGVGGWLQTGRMTSGDFEEDGAGGFYLFATQTLWQARSAWGQAWAKDQEKEPKVPHAEGAFDRGVVAYGQFGMNNSDVLPMQSSFGGGLTAFGFVPGRSKDSFGVGFSTAWLNPRLFERESELMFQTYYQANVVNGVFLQPTLSFIPTPGASVGLGAAWAFTLRTTILF